MDQSETPTIDLQHLPEDEQKALEEAFDLSGEELAAKQEALFRESGKLLKPALPILALISTVITVVVLGVALAGALTAQGPGWARLLARVWAGVSGIGVGLATGGAVVAWLILSRLDEIMDRTAEMMDEVAAHKEQARASRKPAPSDERILMETMLLGFVAPVVGLFAGRVPLLGGFLEKKIMRALRRALGKSLRKSKKSAEADATDAEETAGDAASGDAAKGIRETVDATQKLMRTHIARIRWLTVGPAVTFAGIAAVIAGIPVVVLALL